MTVFTCLFPVTIICQFALWKLLKRSLRLLYNLETIRFVAHHNPRLLVAGSNTLSPVSAHFTDTATANRLTLSIHQKHTFKLSAKHIIHLQISKKPLKTGGLIQSLAAHDYRPLQASRTISIAGKIAGVIIQFFLVITLPHTYNDCQYQIFTNTSELVSGILLGYVIPFSFFLLIFTLSSLFYSFCDYKMVAERNRFVYIVYSQQSTKCIHTAHIDAYNAIS